LYRPPPFDVPVPAVTVKGAVPFRETYHPGIVLLSVHDSVALPSPSNACVYGEPTAVMLTCAHDAAAKKAATAKTTKENLRNFMIDPCEGELG
jgi:hypothetical protein